MKGRAHPPGSVGTRPARLLGDSSESCRRHEAPAQALGSEGVEPSSQVELRSSGDARVALAVLKGLGLLSGQRVEIGDEDPEILRAEAELAERRAANKRALDEICPL